ncbi:MAG: DUF4139 domain-containing protein [Polyangiaceae bacterium]
MGHELSCESRIESVTVYARGAVVRRRVTLPDALPEGPCEVVVEDVTAFADEGTMRTGALEGREVLGVRARLIVPERKAGDPSIKDKLNALRRRRDELVAARGHASWRRDVLASVQPEPDLVRRVSAIDPAERTADALAVVRLSADEMASLDAKIAELTVAIEDNEREAQALRLAAAQAPAAARRDDGPPRFAVTVQLGPAREASKQGVLELEYAVAAARWWPSYRARFTDGATKAALTLSAFVAQASGEDWDGVALALSTGDLLRDARLPEMTSLRLGRAQKPKARGYRPPPEGLDAMFEGYDRFVATVSVTATATASVTTTATMTATRDPSSDVGALWQAGSAGLPAPYAEYHEDEYDSPTRVAPPQEQTRSKKKRAADEPMARAMDLAGLAAPAAPAAAPMPKSAMALGRAAPGGMPMPQAAPPRGGGGAPRAEAASYGGYGLSDDSLGGEGGAPEPLPIEPADAWLDFDSLRIAAWSPGHARDKRGRLTRDGATTPAGLATAITAIERMAPPSGAIDPRASRGLFDVVYAAAGTVDVPSNERPHRVALMTAEAASKPRFVTVPREATEVYRRADFTNPVGQPLLTGPVEVLIDGALVALTRLSYTDRGGSISIGLGVEDRLRVARNTHVEEGSAGLLGGSTTVEHTVTTEIASSLGRAIKVEIVDRLPVSDDKDVEIKSLAASPPTTPYTQAELGHPVRKAFKCEVEVPAGGKAKAEWRYRVTLPAKMEIVGGNRRE